MIIRTFLKKVPIKNGKSQLPEEGWDVVAHGKLNEGQTCPKKS